MVHAVRVAMQSLKKTGTDSSSAQGMDPKEFFKVMGKNCATWFHLTILSWYFLGLDTIVEFDAKVGGSAFKDI